MPRLVQLNELCALPNGTIFSTSDEWGNVRGLYRKGDTIKMPHASLPQDFLYHDLLPDSESTDRTEIMTFPNITDGGRWGNFDPDEYFVVYSEEDVKTLVMMLTTGDAT